MRFIDFFSGIGGERRGMELAGHKCVGFCEFDKYARATYLMMHCMTQEQRKYIESLSKPQRLKEIWNNEEKYANGEWYSTDITRLCARDIPRAECWIFSAPCQSFSMSGKREGLDGESGLVREIFRLLDATEEEDRPEWLIYENVMGMLSSSKGFDFLWILREMDRGGTTLNGNYSTLDISESRRTGKECILSDILEDAVDEKYFLSREQMEKIIFR